MPPTENVNAGSSVVKLGKFQASKMIVRESWNVLKHDKEMMIFPVISTICSAIVLLAFVGGYFFFALSGDWSNIEEGSREAEVIMYSVVFLYYLITFFIVNYFQAGMMLIANARFSGQNLSFGDGLSGATRNSGKIFLFSLISSTVGIILQIISDKSKLLGNIVASIFGAAWQILTYFSLPSLVIGEKSVIESFKDSASVIRKTWGEAIIVNFGVGFVFSILHVIGFFAALGAVITAVVNGVDALSIYIAIGVLYILLVVILSIVSATLSLIFKLVLYKFATTGTIPTGFSRELVQQAVAPKTS